MWSLYVPCSYLLVISQQGLLQSEPEGERNENIGFYGQCMDHANDYSSHINSKKECLRSSNWTCARTEVILFETFYCLEIKICISIYYLKNRVIKVERERAILVLATGNLKCTVVSSVFPKNR
jgi:hypothetical protein